MTRAGTAAAITAAAVAAGAASLACACASPRPADRAVATCRRAVLRRLGAPGATLHNLHADDRGATLYGTVETRDQRGTPVSATFTCTVRGAGVAVDVQPWVNACVPVNLYGEDCSGDQPPAMPYSVPAASSPVAGNG